MTCTPIRPSLFLAIWLASSLGVFAGGSVVPVGTYLYANPSPADVEGMTGALTVRFSTPGPRRLVVAFGRRTRKDRLSRQGMAESERETAKPWKGVPAENGSVARFPHLPPDFYDLVVIDDERMALHEGVALWRQAEPAKATPVYFEEIKGSLGLRSDRIGGWEAFFDAKQFERFETDGARAGVLVQQMRLGQALAESGAVLEGCIHSIDVVWVERAVAEGAGWQVIARQQLYRDEIPARTFFTHAFCAELAGIRVGAAGREIGPIALP